MSHFLKSSTGQELLNYTRPLPSVICFFVVAEHVHAIKRLVTQNITAEQSNIIKFTVDNICMVYHMLYYGKARLVLVKKTS